MSNDTQFSRKELGQLRRECSEKIEKCERVRSVANEIDRISEELDENRDELPQEEINHYENKRSDKKEELNELLPL